MRYQKLFPLMGALAVLIATGCGTSSEDPTIPTVTNNQNTTSNTSSKGCIPLGQTIQFTGNNVQFENFRTLRAGRIPTSGSLPSSGSGAPVSGTGQNQNSPSFGTLSLGATGGYNQGSTFQINDYAGAMNVTISNTQNQNYQTTASISGSITLSAQTQADIRRAVGVGVGGSNNPVPPPYYNPGSSPFSPSAPNSPQANEVVCINDLAVYAVVRDANSQYYGNVDSIEQAIAYLYTHKISAQTGQVIGDANSNSGVQVRLGGYSYGYPY